MTRVKYEKIEMDDVIDLTQGEPKFHVLPQRVAEIVDVEITGETHRFVDRDGVTITEHDREQAGDLLNKLNAILPGADFKRVARKFFLSRLKEEVEEDRAAAEKKSWQEAKAEFRSAVSAWKADGFRLQKPGGSAAHRFVEARRANRVRCLSAEQSQVLAQIGQIAPIPFVIEHDWAAAFANAIEMSEGEYPLPYDEVLFEFRINNHIVALYAGAAGTAIMLEAKLNWLILAASNEQISAQTTAGFSADIPTTNLIELLLRQVRAVCIALDADVITTETVRAPQKLNKARAQRGKPPLADYHVVRLNRRGRAVALPDEHEPTKHRSPRLHFVRGHWRHYETHKTWIKWHLRGDPDLGFIDKHYRL